MSDIWSGLRRAPRAFRVTWIPRALTRKSWSWPLLNPFSCLIGYFSFREIMYRVACLRRASSPCFQSRAEGFAPFQLNHYTRLYPTGLVMARAQVVFLPVAGHWCKIIPPCHLSVWMSILWEPWRSRSLDGDHGTKMLQAQIPCSLALSQRGSELKLTPDHDYAGRGFRGPGGLLTIYIEFFARAPKGRRQPA